MVSARVSSLLGCSLPRGCMSESTQRQRFPDVDGQWHRILCLPAEPPFISLKACGGPEGSHLSPGLLSWLPSSFQVAQPQPRSCHISYWIGCLIKIIIKIDLLISMHLLCLSHPCVPLSTEDVKTDRREPDPRPAQPSGAGR